MEIKYKVGLVVAAILTVLGFMASVYGLSTSGSYAFTYWVRIIAYICIFYYAVNGYKKPHGNMLRNLMLIFGASLVAELTNAITFQVYMNVHILACATLLVGFVAGRLHKFNQNRVIMLIILALLLAVFCIAITAHSPQRGLLSCLVIISPAIMWFDLVIAYFTRFNQHKESGLVEK